MPNEIPAATAKQALYTKINQANNVTYNEINVAMNAPAVQPDPNVSAKNTTVLLTGIPAAGKFGSARIYYDRVTLQSVTSVDPVELSWDSETMISDLIPKINDMFDIMLTEDDIIDAALPPRADGFTSFSIVASADSYGWTGFFIVQLDVEPGDVGEEIVVPVIEA